MNFYFQKSSDTDQLLIYEIKKASNYRYVDEIWGWDEDYQQKDFYEDFNNETIDLIMVDHCCVGFLQLEENTEKIEIIEIHIIPEFQGKSIGSTILKGLIKKASLQNKDLYIGCFLINEKAKKLYEKLGFKIIKRTDTHYLLKY